MSDQEKQCRICLDGVEAEPELGRLIRPCLCKGSISVSIWTFPEDREYSTRFFDPVCARQVSGQVAEHFSNQKCIFCLPAVSLQVSVHENTHRRTCYQSRQVILFMTRSCSCLSHESCSNRWRDIGCPIHADCHGRVVHHHILHVGFRETVH